MARITKEHDVRVKEILDTAQTLFYRKGYDDTSVADIIAVNGIAKGTFYHYFRSKDDLLDRIIGRIAGTIEMQLTDVVDDPESDALAKLRSFFLTAGTYKLENVEAVRLAARVMYRDVNLRLKERLQRGFFDRAAPLLTRLVRQGVREGAFAVEHERHVAGMILYLGFFLRDEFSEALAMERVDIHTAEAMVEKTMAYQEAIERILGAPNGSLRMMSPGMIRAFFPHSSSTDKEQVC